MTTQNFKTIISYNGGCAGDLFVKSCNDETLSNLRFGRVVQPSTLKEYEHKLRMGIETSLDEELEKLPHKFVNTHMLEEVVGKGHTVYNIIMTDPQIQLTTIYRQMQIQKLRIKIHTDEWYTTIRNYCLEKDYISAANHWFAKAEQLWLDRMNYRLKFADAEKLDFNLLYTDRFVDSLLKQGWTHNATLLKYNHAKWLEENNTFTFENTINTMASKLSTMNWEQQEGWVEYNPVT